MIITLTELYYDDDDRPEKRRVDVNIHHIVWYQRHPGALFTSVVMSDKTEFDVEEEMNRIKLMIQQEVYENGRV